MPRASYVALLAICVATLPSCLPEPDCAETATCPPAFEPDAGFGSRDSSTDISSDGRGTPGSDGSAGESGNTGADSAAGAGGTAGGGGSPNEGGSGALEASFDSGGDPDANTTPFCPLGEIRRCPQYSFAPAIPDETACRDGKPCSAQCKSGTQTCIAANGGAPFWSACQGAIGPSPSDTCELGNDGNCNGIANEGCTCVNGTTKSCGDALGAKGKCAAGMTICSAGAWGACSIIPAASDNCALAGDDSNCNGLTNDSCPCTPGATGTCSARLGAKGGCAAGTATCNASGTGWTCSVTPAAQDTCDSGNDATCDGTPNQGCTCINGSMSTCAMALNLVGPCAMGTTTCTSGAWGVCSVRPTTDTCDRNNDNNCDGVANNPPGGCACINGTTATCGSALSARGACASGMTSCAAGAWGACSVQPAARDMCDRGNDANCNGTPNEACTCINGTSCSDGDSCTRTDTCVNGACVGSNPVTCQPTECHAAGTCDRATGTCGAGAPTPNAPCNSLPNGVCNAAGTCACPTGSSACGGTTCADLTIDGANCGVCGHNCQGGACVQGVCQAKLIASIPASGSQSVEMVLSGSRLYVQFFGGGVPAGTINTFEVATDGSQPTGFPVRATAPTDSLANALDGALYWPSSVDGTSYVVKTCTIGSCASTTRTIATRSSSSGNGIGVTIVVADTAAHQLVLRETESSGLTSILRVTPAGVVTPIVTLGGGFLTVWSSTNRPDRAFFASQPSAGTFLPSYVSTTTIGALPIPLLPSAQSGSAFGFMANDNTAYWNSADASGANPMVSSAPLPNGIVTGSAPRFFLGNITGVVDATSAFGVFSTTATDVVARCPLSSCTPVAIARGQSLPQHFFTDNVAVYWVGFGFVTTSVVNVYAAIK